MRLTRWFLISEAAETLTQIHARSISFLAAVLPQTQFDLLFLFFLLFFSVENTLGGKKKKNVRKRLAKIFPLVEGWGQISSELPESTVYFCTRNIRGIGIRGRKAAGISLTEERPCGKFPCPPFSSGFSPIDWLMLWEPV